MRYVERTVFWGNGSDVIFKKEKQVKSDAQILDGLQGLGRILLISNQSPISLSAEMVIFVTITV